MLIDYHIHTSRCRHADGRMADYLSMARKRGLSEIGFSDHCPYLREFEYSMPAGMIAMPVGEFDDYVRDVRNLGKSAPIPVKLGLEIDFFPDDFRVFSFVNRHAFDYFIGSVHFMGGWGFDQENFRSAFQTDEKHWIRYLGLVENMAQSGLFDIVGHFDLPKKFGDRPGKRLKPYFLRTLRAIKSAGMAVELNTGGADKPVGEFYPSPDILKMCFSLDIPVSLGSDSHKPGHIGRHFAEARKLLRQTGYRSTVSFTRHLTSRIEL